MWPWNRSFTLEAGVPKNKTPALSEEDETTGALWFVTALFCWRSAWVSCLSLLRSGRQTSRPSAPSGADMRLPVFLPLYHSACDELVGCLIGNNNRNCKLRIPDCHIGSWNIIYTVGECVTSFCFFGFPMCSVCDVKLSHLGVGNEVFLSTRPGFKKLDSLQMMCSVWLLWWTDIITVDWIDLATTFETAVPK